MNLSISGIWPRVLDLLKNELTEISFNTWINTIEPVSSSSDTIVLGVPTDFNKGILESRYVTLISNAIKQVTLKEYTIRDNCAFPGTGSKMKSSSDHRNEELYNSVLNPKYTFDTFVIGNREQAGSCSRSGRRGSSAQAYNPLFLYGGSRSRQDAPDACHRSLHT